MILLCWPGVLIMKSGNMVETLRFRSRCLICRPFPKTSRMLMNWETSWQDMECFLSTIWKWVILWQTKYSPTNSYQTTFHPLLILFSPNLSTRLLEASIHPDLRTDKIILKPRYGERGKGIEVISLSEVDNPRIQNMQDYIVQPLMESDSGIPELNIPGRHDLRMLIYNGEVMDFFIRVASDNNFICNQSHGGRISYFQLDELPERFRTIAREVDLTLCEYMPQILQHRYRCRAKWKNLGLWVEYYARSSLECRRDW